MLKLMQKIDWMQDVKCIYRYRNVRFSKAAAEESQQILILKDIINKGKTLSPVKWNEVKSKVISSGHLINQVNFDAVLIGSCYAQKQLDIAKSYYQYLKTLNTNANNATIGKLLKLYYMCYEDKPLPAEAEKEIYDLCASLRTTYGHLDSFSAENAICAMSLTKNWNKCLKYLNGICLTSVPTANVYSIIIAAGFNNNDETLAWTLLNRMQGDDRKPTLTMYKGFLNYCSNNEKESLLSFEKLFRYISTNEILLPVEVATRLIQMAKKAGFRGRQTSVKINGRCQNCQQMLNPLKISPDEFCLLRDTFYERVIIGKNIFTKTTPKELTKFNQFVDSVGQADIVIDGLNVAYSTGMQKSPQQFTKLLANVIQQFVHKKKHVILLGRAHMRNWRTPYMKYIEDNSSIFFAENLSLDDPFLLYATMHSGPDTGFLSRDLMRSHAYKLTEPHVQSLFRRWQNSIQFQLSYVDQNGQAHIQPPLRFMPSAQKTENFWHIPLDSDEQMDRSNATPVSKTWLCFEMPRK